jgi:hypothetical protein
MILTTLLTFSLHLAHADQTAEVNKNAQPVTSALAAKQDEEGGGEALIEEASLTRTRRRSHGYSWRNTQYILMGRGTISCRLGGLDARTAAVPALLSAGYCDVTKDNKAKNAKKMPIGTVWVYDHLPHGNAVVKMAQDKFFDNSLHDSLPIPRGGEKVTILKPGCGKKRACGDFKVFRDAANNTDAATVSEDNSEFIQNAIHPSEARLEAEKSCGYANAFRATENFNQCVEEKLSK